MKVSGNALRPGNVILFEKRIWVVVKAQHTQPGKGGAYMCVILRDIRDGTKKDHRFRSAEDVEKLSIQEEQYTFLYQEGSLYMFMNCISFDNVGVTKDLFNVSENFLSPGMAVTIGLHEENPIYVTLPTQVVLTITEADMVVKGQTATGSYKPAVLSNGMKTMVPPYIEVDTQVLIKTEDCTYIERFKGEA